jgi:hypothetical protein
VLARRPAKEEADSSSSGSSGASLEVRGVGARTRDSGLRRRKQASLRRSGFDDEVAEPRKGWQARGSQANLFVIMSLWGSVGSSVRGQREAREGIGLWVGL